MGSTTTSYFFLRAVSATYWTSRSWRVFLSEEIFGQTCRMWARVSLVPQASHKPDSFTPRPREARILVCRRFPLTCTACTYPPSDSNFVPEQTQVCTEGQGHADSGPDRRPTDAAGNSTPVLSLPYSARNLRPPCAPQQGLWLEPERPSSSSPYAG